jgi:HemY protein
MRTVIALILLTAAAVGAGWWLQHLAGSLSLSIGTLQVQAPLSIAILVLIGVVLCVYVLLRLIATFLHLPGAFRSRGDRSRRVRGDAAVTNTLIALAAREPADARRQAARARRLLGDTPQTLLLSAYAGSIAGDEAEAEAAFEKLAERRDSAFLGLRGLLRQAVSRGDLPRAHELARQAEKAQPGASWLREERAHLAVRTGDWHDALQLTTEDAPRAALAAAAAEKENDFDTARKLAKQAWKKDPTLPAAAIAYARRLREGGREKSAQDVLRRSWTANPHPSLAAFALEPAADKLARLKTGTSLVSGAPDHVESHLLLGRLALEAGNPADAARHAQAARATGMDQRRLHMLHADIADAEGNEAAQRDALRHAAAAGPDPSWRCTNCGATHDLWLPACPACHAIGKIAWVTAPKGLLAAPVRVRPGALPLDPAGA